MPTKKTDPDDTPQPARRTRAASTEVAAPVAPDRTLYWAVAFLAAVVFFGAGYLVGHETGDNFEFGHHGRGMIIVGGPSELPGNPGMFPPYSELPDRPDANDQGGFLGIAGMDTPGGVRIAEVVPDGPADEAGVEVGDRIVAFDGTEISSMEQLADLVGATEPGTDVELVLGGPNGARTVTVTIGERP